MVIIFDFFNVHIFFVSVQSNRGKYIPPHLRASLQSSANENSEVIQRLRKLMKGALNRLTESNMHSITAQVLYYRLIIFNIFVFWFSNQSQIHILNLWY